MHRRVTFHGERMEVPSRATRRYKIYYCYIAVIEVGRRRRRRRLVFEISNLFSNVYFPCDWRSRRAHFYFIIII